MKGYSAAELVAVASGWGRMRATAAVGWKRRQLRVKQQQQKQQLLMRGRKRGIERMGVLVSWKRGADVAGASVGRGRRGAGKQCDHLGQQQHLRKPAASARLETAKAVAGRTDGKAAKQALEGPATAFAGDGLHLTAKKRRHASVLLHRQLLSLHTHPTVAGSWCEASYQHLAALQALADQQQQQQQEELHQEVVQRQQQQQLQEVPGQEQERSFGSGAEPLMLVRPPVRKAGSQSTVREQQLQPLHGAGCPTDSNGSSSSVSSSSTTGSSSACGQQEVLGLVCSAAVLRLQPSAPWVAAAVAAVEVTWCHWSMPQLLGVLWGLAQFKQVGGEGKVWLVLGLVARRVGWEAGIRKLPGK